MTTFWKILNTSKKKNKIKIEITNDNTLIIPDHVIEFQNKSKKIIEKIETITKLKKLENMNEKIKSQKSPNKKFKKKKFYKKKYFKKNN